MPDILLRLTWAFITSTRMELAGLDGEIAWGMNFSNLGTKISYTEGSDKQFIPANFRIGARYSLDLDEYNSLTASIDLNKLLVPTPPIDYVDSVDADGNPVIQYGMKAPASIPMSWIQSFYDAPERLSGRNAARLCISGGLEYWYSKQFAIRAGYFHESQKSRVTAQYFACRNWNEAERFFYRFFLSHFHLREEQSPCQYHAVHTGIEFQ